MRIWRGRRASLGGGWKKEGEGKYCVCGSVLHGECAYEIVTPDK